MNFWNFNKKKSNPLDDAPFIFPYFFNKEQIKLKWHSENVSVEIIEDTKLKMWGHCYFKTRSNKVIGAINFWTYFKQTSETSFICYTLPRDDNSSMESFAAFYYFNTEDLNPINNIEAEASEMKRLNQPFLFNTQIVKLIIPKLLEIGLNTFHFPEKYKVFDELLIFSNKKDLYPDAPPNSYWADYVLISLRPHEDVVEIIPQDWFNKSDADFGYVWPTRISRNKNDKRLYGQGIRMDNFILDPSGKKHVG